MSSAAATGSPRLLNLVRLLPKSRSNCLLSKENSSSLIKCSSSPKYYESRYDNCGQPGQRVRKFSSWMKSPLTVNLNGYYHGGGGGSGRNRSKGREVGETTILCQEGSEIQEVPLALLKRSEGEGEKGEDTFSSGDCLPGKSYIDLNAREEAAFVEAFSSYNTPQQILKMLDTIPSQEVTPFVSLSILKKLFELENNFLFRNDGRSWLISAENSTIETFARLAIVSRLIDTIVSTDNPDVLLETLETLRCERVIENGSQNENPLAAEATSNYRNKVFEEVLVRVNEGKFNLTQVCKAVVSLGKMEVERGTPLKHDYIDKLWVGILEKSEDIDVENIVQVFRVIPFFKKSRRLVLNLAEKKVLSFWWKMDCSLVSQICAILIDEDTNSALLGNDKLTRRRRTTDSWGVSNRLLQSLSRCTSLNIHKVQEEELIKIVKAFYSFNFCDESIEKALNKYMKAKCLKISNPQLVAVVLDYAKKVGIRSTNILEAAAEFVTAYKGSLSPPQVTSIVTAFGHLDFQPPHGVRFWQIIESFLDEKFIQFPPKDIVDALLSCVYLKKFPINFVDRIFSPYFLDRLHTSEQEYNLLQNMRSNLKLLDSSFTIECPSKYNGPLLPKDFTARSVFVDGRVLRMANVIEDILREIIRSEHTVEQSVILPGLPFNSLYIADLLISSVKTSDADRFNHMRNRIAARLNTGVTCSDNPRNLTILLIHLPEHYSGNGDNLIGPQTMRIRHLRALGFKVTTLNFEKLAELKVHPEPLKDYLKQVLLDSEFPVI